MVGAVCELDLTVESTPCLEIDPLDVLGIDSAGVEYELTPVCLAKGLFRLLGWSRRLLELDRQNSGGLPGLSS